MTKELFRLRLQFNCRKKGTRIKALVNNIYHNIPLNKERNTENRANSGLWQNETLNGYIFK